jgi:hypothetical protein
MFYFGEWPYPGRLLPTQRFGHLDQIRSRGPDGTLTAALGRVSQVGAVIAGVRNSMRMAALSTTFGPASLKRVITSSFGGCIHRPTGRSSRARDPTPRGGRRGGVLPCQVEWRGAQPPAGTEPPAPTAGTRTSMGMCESCLSLVRPSWLRRVAGRPRARPGMRQRPRRSDARRNASSLSRRLQR